MGPPFDVEDRLNHEIAAGRMMRNDAEELHQRLDLLAFNMTLAGQMGEVTKEAAAAWLFHLRTRKLATRPHAPLEERARAGRWWAFGEATGFLRVAENALRFTDMSLQVYFCTHFCRSRPIDALLLRLAARPAFREVWRLWAKQDEHLIEQLTTLLGATQRQRRARVAMILGYIGGPRATDALLAALQDQSGGVRLMAAKALGAIGDERAIEPLITLLLRDYFFIGSAIADTLAQFGEPAVLPLLNLLPRLGLLERQRGVVVQRWIFEVLGKLKDQRAIPPLLKLLNHQDPVLAYRAAKALSSFGEPVLAPLLQALTSDDRRLRERAAYALGYTGAAQAAAPLLRLLRKRWEHPYVYQMAYEAVVRLGNGEALPLLLTALQDKKKLVRACAAEALGELGDRRAMEPLLMALQDIDPNVRSKAARALGRLGDQQAIEALIDALSDQEWPVRKFAAEALGNLDDQRAVEPLLTALREPNHQARAQVIRALGKLGDTRAVQPLLSLLREPDLEKFSGVKDWTIRVLGNLGDQRAVEPLLTLLEETGRGEQESGRRAIIIEALGQLGDRRAVPALIAILEQDTLFLRCSAAQALGAIGDRQALHALKRAQQTHSSRTYEGQRVKSATSEAIERIQQGQQEER